MSLTLCTVLLPLLVHSAISVTLDPVSIPGNGEMSACPAQEDVDAVRQTLRASAQKIAQKLEYNPDCGPGLWYRVAYCTSTSAIPHSSVPLPGESITLME